MLSVDLLAATGGLVSGHPSAAGGPQPLSLLPHGIPVTGGLTYPSPVTLPHLAPQPLTIHTAQPTIATTQRFVTNSLKRGSDDLISSHSPMVTNGNTAVMSPTSSDSNNEAKKVKLENNTTKPSRVLHFRGVPMDATEGEIVQLGLPFGRMTNLVLAKKKNQALLEMADVESAQAMVQYFIERPPQIRGRTVYVQFSNHEVLKTEATNQNAGAQAALQAASQLMSVDEPRTVLRVIIEHMLYPVTIDVLKQIFSRYGQVMKIVTFSKNNTFQALIQYSDPIAAQTAKVSLNGQNIYNGCCTLRIDFSKLPSLNVKYNNDKSRDYTNPTLPSGDGASQLPMEPAGPLGFGGQDNFMHHPDGGGQITSPFMAAASTGMANLGATLTSAYGATSASGMPFMGADPMVSHLGSVQAPAGFAAFNAAQMPFGLAGALSAPGVGAAAGLRLGAPNCSSVLLVSNLNEEAVTPDALFTLFGVYGDVIRVKIMFNKKDNALIQFTDATMAQCAMTHLDKLKVWGKQIKVAPSKHSVVQMPKEGQPDAGLTKDYSTSSLHRFKKPNSKNHHNIFPPSATLHLSNIPPTTTEEQLRELFEGQGQVVAFKFFQKDRKMALVQMSAIDEAVEALIATHNHQLAETSHLRVSFSKSTIQPPSGAPGAALPAATAAGIQHAQAVHAAAQLGAHLVPVSQPVMITQTGQIVQ